ncbi:MAG: hypothetical protein ABIJ65_13970, partial [Chloroflexota bacterium]
MKKRSQLFMVFLLLAGITLACILTDPLSEIGANESLFEIKTIRVEPPIGFPGEFTLIVEDYDYVDKGVGGANNVLCSYYQRDDQNIFEWSGKSGDYEGDDFRKDKNGNYMRDMTDEERFTRKFMVNDPGIIYYVGCTNQNDTTGATFQVIKGFEDKDCETGFSMPAGLEMDATNNPLIRPYRLYCLWRDGVNTAASQKIIIDHVLNPEVQGNLTETQAVFNDDVNKSEGVIGYCRNESSNPDVVCSCNETKTQGEDHYLRIRSGGCKD